MSGGNIEYNVVTECYCHDCGGEFTLNDGLKVINILTMETYVPEITCPYCNKKSTPWTDGCSE